MTQHQTPHRVICSEHLKDAVLRTSYIHYSFTESEGSADLILGRLREIEATTTKTHVASSRLSMS